MTQMKKLLSIVLLLCLAIGSSGQNLMYSTSNEVNTKLVLMPPYPLDFRGLLDQPGNQIILHNLADNTKQVSLNFSLNSTDGNVSVTGKKPVLSITLTPRGTVSIPLSELGVLISQNLLTCLGVSYNDIASNRVLPDGYYSVCVTPMEVSSNKLLGNEACSNVFPIMAIEPPVLRLTNSMSEDTVLNVTPQNLQFQWNLMASRGIAAMSGVRTTLRVVEVPKGMSPNQAILSTANSSRIPQFSVENGRNNFVYGPTLSPLVKGRRYAAVVQMIDPTGKVIFRNNGTSEVVSFVFGRPVFDPLDNSSTNVTGSIKWAYKEVELLKESANNPLVFNSLLIENRREAIKNNKPSSTETYPLGGALINVFGSDVRPNGIAIARQTIGTTKSDENGQFSLSLVLKQAMKKFKYITFEASHPLGAFSKAIQTVETAEIIEGTNLKPIVLTAQTMELTPRVILADGSVNNNVTINVLMPQKQWSKYALLEQAGLASSKNTVTYGNQSYSIVASLNNGNTFKRLFQTISPNEHYLIQVNYPDKASAYYPLDNVYMQTFDRYAEKPIIEISKNFIYDNTNKVSGTVIYKGKGQVDVRVEAIINPADILGKVDVSAKYTAITENDGNYIIAGLPNLKHNAVIKFVLTDKTLSNYPITDEVVAKKNTDLTKDFTINIKKVTVSGRLLDKKGNPIDYALVLLKSSNKTTHTDNAGNYSIELEQAELLGQFQFKADGFKDTSILVENKVVRRVKDKDFLSVINRGNTVLDENTNNSRVQINVMNMDNETPVTQGTLTIKSNTGIVNTIEVDLTKNNSNSYTFNFAGKYDAKGYEVIFTPIKDGSTRLAPVVAQVSLINNRMNAAITLLATTTKITLNGMVKTYTYASPPIKTAVAQQLITVVNTTYKAVSDKNGRFQLIVDSATKQVIEASRTGFVTTDTTFKDLTRGIISSKQDSTFAKSNTVTDTLYIYSNDKQVISTLLGMPVTISSKRVIDSVTISSVKTYYYSIGGYITVPDNNVYKLTSSNTYGSNLYFTGVTVGIDANGATNAIPVTVTNHTTVAQLSSISFNVSTLNLLAWNYAPVQVNNLVLNKVTPTGSNMTTGTLSGTLLLNPTSPTSNTIALPMADTIGVSGTSKISTVFALPKGTNISNTSYAVYLSKNKTIALPNMNSNLVLDSVQLSATGIVNYSSAYVKYSTIQGITWIKSTDSVFVNNLSFGTDFALKSFTVLQNLSANIQKMGMTINSIQINGLNTSNVAWNFGGNLAVTKNDTKALSFTTMTMPSVSNGYAMSTSLGILMKYIPLQVLKIVPSGATASLSYSSIINSYNVNFAITLDTAAKTTDSTESSAFTTICGQVKGLTGQISIQSSNLGFLVAVSANKEIDLKVVKLGIGSFVLSVGSGASLDYMDSIVLGKNVSSTAITYDTSNTSPDKSDWAFGISGSLTFPAAKDMKGGKDTALDGTPNGGGGIILVSFSKKYGFRARVDTLFMNITTSTMTVNAGGSMVFDEVKKGFAVNASVLINSIGKNQGKGLAGTFKYYSFAAGGFQLGASITVTAEIPAGPVTFHSLGGGFDVNTNTQEYNVFIMGDLGPKGVPADKLDVKVFLNILFSAACDYVPIITGTGSAVINKDITIATANMTLDICHRFMAVTIDANVNKGMPIPAPLDKSEIKASAILFIAAPYGSQQGCFLLAVDIKANIPVILPNATAGFGIGYNAYTSNPYLPKDIAATMSSFVGTGALNGIYVTAQVIKTNNFNFDYHIFGVGVYLYFNQSTKFNMSFYADLSANASFQLSAALAEHVDAGFGIDLCAFSVGLGGNLDANFNIKGGYSKTAGFNLSGNGSLQVQVWGGTSGAQNIGCNDYHIATCSKQVCLWGLCTWWDYPCGLQVKACIGVSGSFGIQSGKAPYFNINL